jgi:hypothetical protein
MQEIVVALHDELPVLHDAHHPHPLGPVGVRHREAHRVRGQLADVERLAARDAHAREVEELGEETAQPVRLAHHEMRERPLVVARELRPGELLAGAANGRERILDLVRERRGELGDALEPLGAETQRLDALLVGDVVEDRRGRAVGDAAVAVGVGGAYADGKASPDGRDHPLGARRAHPLPDRVLDGLHELRCDAAHGVEHGTPEHRVQVQTEQLFRHRVRVEQASARVDGEDAAADVEQDVGGLEPEMREHRLRPRARLLELLAEPGAAKCHEGEHAKLEPHGSGERNVHAPEGVGDVEHVAERGDEQPSADGQQQGGRRDDEDV